MLPPPEVLPRSAAVREDGRLTIGGCDLEALAERFGTPLVVYDEGTLRDNARAYAAAMREHAPGGEVVYASKAYFGLAMLRIVRDEGLSVDVASGGELHAALTAGIRPERIELHGNNKDDAELEQALDAGIGTVVIDGVEEIARLDEIAARHGRRQRVLVRVTPGVKPSTHSYIATGQLDSKFGVSLENGSARRAVDVVATSPHLAFGGLHCHIGSQLFDLGAYRVAAALLAEFARELGPIPVETMNMGGGLGIAYTGADQPPTIEGWVEHVAESVRDEWTRVGLPVPRLAVEPGRSLVGRAGVTLYRVGAIKDIPGVRTYVAVDGGMSDLIRPMLYGAVYEPVHAARPLAEPSGTVRIVGKHCESGDVLVGEASLPTLARGDVICLPATGAYGFSMASNYNGVTRPAVVFVGDGQARLVTRRETFDDLLARDL